MYRSLFKVILLISVTFTSLNCGTTLIKEQTERNLSAVTMYIDAGFVTEGVSVKNLSTGEVFYNKRYSWGKEFFPDKKKFSFLSIGNIKPGRYSFHKIVIWYFPPGEKQKKDIEITIPNDVFQFIVQPNDILYLGDIRFIILAPESNNINVNKYMEELTSKRITVKKFKTFIPFKNSELEVLYVNGVEPNGNKEIRPGEEFFLKFFVSNKSKIPSWAKISELKLKEAEDYERTLKMKELEKRTP